MVFGKGASGLAGEFRFSGFENFEFWVSEV